MWEQEQIIAFIRDRLSENRFKHVLGVKDAAERLAEVYGIDKEKAAMAALIHDCAKNMKDDELLKIADDNGYRPDFIELNSPQLLHSVVAAIIAKEKMDVKDEEILNAVIYHTTGRQNMSMLEKIIYIADYIEPSRSFPGVEDLRKAAFEDINRAMLMALENTIRYVISKRELIHVNTIDARNYILLESEKRVDEF